SNSGSYTNGAQVAITADAPASGKIFDQWTGDTQYVASVSSTNTTVTMPAQPIILTATYKDAPYYALTVTSAYGGSDPSGTNSYNTPVSIMVTNSPVLNDTTQYVCVGWTGTGSAPANGTTTNTGLFTMTNDSTLVWLWTTNYLLQVDKTGSGSVSTSNVWLADGTNIQITATADAYYHFISWSGDTGGDTNSSPLILVMSGARSVTANFAPNITTNTATPEWWLAQYGLTNFNTDALTDIDLDSMATWQEYIAGTDPTNRSSVLAVACTVFPNGHRTLSWFGVQGRAYTLQYVDSLNTNNWQSSSFESSGLDAAISLTDDQIEPKYFYRVKVRIVE
ncbi:MAG: hypothetical protein M0R47_21700, partial [Methylobacter sp.]|uniref:InlB B-repeat-containing protein n=1 Tax=Methylobacter sp. TaxID=2051955 RepID=UPI0025E39E0F